MSRARNLNPFSLTPAIFRYFRGTTTMISLSLLSRTAVLFLAAASMLVLIVGHGYLTWTSVRRGDYFKLVRYLPRKGGVTDRDGTLTSTYKAVAPAPRRPLSRSASRRRKARSMPSSRSTRRRTSASWLRCGARSTRSCPRFVPLPLALLTPRRAPVASHHASAQLSGLRSKAHASEAALRKVRARPASFAQRSRPSLTRVPLRQELDAARASLSDAQTQHEKARAELLSRASELSEREESTRDELARVQGQKGALSAELAASRAREAELATRVDEVRSPDVSTRLRA